MSWTKSYPKQCSKNDLSGMKLRVLSDKPPTDSNVKGMLSLIVMDTATSATFAILVTHKDVSRICSIIEGGKAFSFDATKPYAEVIEFE